MTTRELTTQYRMTQWAQIMQERAASGESIRSFCESRDIRRNTYFYWQRKLRAAAGAALQSQTSDKMVPVGWAACAPEPESPQASGVSIEIGKCRVVVGVDWELETLQKVCQALTELC